MNKTYAYEDDILEQLDQQSDIYGLLSKATQLIDECSYQLMLRIFRKEKYAFKFVISALIGSNGLLNQFSVRLKLLYALGIISYEEYEDIELIIALKEEIEDSPQHYTYSDDEILGPITLLHDIAFPPDVIEKTANGTSTGIVNALKRSRCQPRQQQMIRSALIISLTNLIFRISQKHIQFIVN